MSVLIERLKRHAELSKPEGIAYDCERAAALITELYEALREAADMLDVAEFPEGRDTVKRARAALAKVDA